MNRSIFPANNPIIQPVTPQVTAATPPTLTAIQANLTRIRPWIRKTPLWQLDTPSSQNYFGGTTTVFYKMELWQHAGTFKPRGAITHLFKLSKAQLKRGITAVSAGNHAIATAYAASVFGTHAKVLMPKTACELRQTRCKALGAEIVLTDDIHAAFDRSNELVEKEGRYLVHPFEGDATALGTATLGLELCEQIEALDAVVVAIGGGGLCGGMSAAIKQINPACKIYGVEPEGANTMTRSFQSGQCETLNPLTSICDSLSSPHSREISYSLCAQFCDGIVNVSDTAIIDAMHFLFEELSLAVEPACAASTAALMGPLKETLNGKRIAVILCGSNIDLAGFNQLLK